MAYLRPALTLIVIGLLVARFIRKRRSEARFAEARKARLTPPPADGKSP